MQKLGLANGKGDDGKKRNKELKLTKLQIEFSKNLRQESDGEGCKAVAAELKKFNRSADEGVPALNKGVNAAKVTEAINILKNLNARYDKENIKN